MIDKKVKQKKRDKIQKLIQDRVKASEGKMTEQEARKAVMKEQRDQSKQKKRQSELEISQKVRKELEGKDEKVIDKAVKKAISQYHSKNKKAKNPQTQLKKKADDLILNVNSRLWCPKDQSWWDEECQDSFDELQFLAECWNINLLKKPQNFAETYPIECKTYFDLLAKKRFNSDGEDKASGKKTKNALEKKFEERKADVKNNNKSDKDLMEEVVTEMVEANKATQLKELKKTWRPSHKPFFDKECQEAFKNLSESATKQGFDLDNTASDFRKFRRKNRKECAKYFKFLDRKREACDIKQKMKEERKASEVKNVKKEEEFETSPPQNKKIKFDEGEESGKVDVERKPLQSQENTVEKKKKKKKSKDLTEVTEGENVKTEVDIDNTIRKIDKKLKKAEEKTKLSKKTLKA